jgi:hypothetical protein
MLHRIVRRLFCSASDHQKRLRSKRRFRPRVEALEGRVVPSATTRPISDFLSAQGTTSAFPNGIESGGPAGLPDELGWTTSTATFNNGTAAFARMDYTGQDAAFLGLNLGTTTSGTISEITLADGTARDTVNLQTHNAFAWAENFFPTPTLTFGYLPSQLAANPSLVPPVGNCNLQVVIDIPHPGAPLPDIVVALNLGGVPGDTIESLAFRGTAGGTTPSGQAAQLVISQTAVLSRTPNLVRDFGSTAEVVSVQVNHGTGSAAATAQTTLAAAASPTATTRPISDFLSAQGTTSLFPNGIDPTPGPAGLPDELGWSTSTATFNNGTAAFARMDYTGQDAAFLGLHLGTTTSGTISEVTLPDGTARDTVNLHTHNAFVWAENFFPTPTLTFGYLPSQLAANPSLVPPVGDCDTQAVIHIPYPGAPLPDIVATVILGQGGPGYSVESYSFHGTASGTTPSGQAAQLVISQTGVNGRTPIVVRDFGFTAEVVSVKVNKGASLPAASTIVSSASPSPAPSLRAVPAAAADAVFGNALNNDPLASGL